MLIRVPTSILVLAFVPGCLFNTETEGLKCSQNSHCQAGQACSEGVCKKSGDTGAESESGTDGGSESGSESGG